jgi:hypothetical protein
MYHICSAATISHQNTFNRTGFSADLSDDLSRIIKPDYKDFVPPPLIRRMSDILRMSVACSTLALKNAQIEQPDAIITGTGLGCIFETEKFLNNVISLEGGLLPPTSFIQSTHNTIAGQISLVLGNHQYNMTHTQNSLSFEHALFDALLYLDEHNGHVLAGAADENIEQLQPLSDFFKLNDYPLTSGCTFFVISRHPQQHALATICQCKTVYPYHSLETELQNFLSTTGVSNDINLILTDGRNASTKDILNKYFPEATIAEYLKYSGLYATASAFGLHLAVDILNTNNNLKTNKSSKTKYTLLVNTLLPCRIGFILLKPYEA